MFNELLEDLKRAKRPVLLIGGGCQNYRKEFKALSEVLRIPTYATWNALDIVTSDLETYAGVVGTYGGPGRNFGIQSCDLLLSIGSRLSGRVTGGTPSRFARHAKKYVVDIEGAIPVDAGAYMAGLRDRLLRDELDFTLDHEDWLKRCKDWAIKYDPVKPEHLSGPFHHYGFVRKLSELLPADAIVVSDTGGSVIMMGHCFRSKWGQRLFTSNGNTTMGFGFAAALGAWFASKRPVICLIGDGGFNMHLQEIQTMINYGCNVKTFILNNHCYGTTKLWQKNNKKAFLACGPDGYRPPDFMKIAEAYDVSHGTIDNWDNFDSRMQFLFDAGSSWIVDVVHEFYDYYPRINRFDQDLEDQDPPLPREEIERNMA